MPTHRPRSFALLAVVAALGFGLAGCGDDDDESSTPTTAGAGGGSEGGGDGSGNRATIDMKDYAYAIDGDLTAGTTTLELRNTGDEMHMAAFAQMKPGKTLADVQAALQSEEEDAGADVFEKELGSPGGLLSPGKTQEVTTPFLEAGTYALICFIPTAGTAGEPGVGAPHFVNGMVGTLEVAQGDAEAPDVDADASYTVADGTPKGPATLESGETTLSVTVGAGAPHEFFVIRRKDPATTFETIDKAFTDLFEGETPPPKGYVANFPAEIVGSTFDMDEGDTALLGVNLEPGSYLIGCAYEDEEGSAAHNEFLEVTVT